ncbi:MAG TPA: S8 family serine peptidase [Gemmatimonadales bacterium]|nr:S8 family serine peptidase [Gemmatimonadales bacterium]
MQRMRVNAAWSLGVVALVGALALGPIERAAAQSPQASPARPALFKDSRGELAMARARGDTAVTVILAARRGRSDEAAAAIRRLGGTVQKQVKVVDYLRARVPIDRVETVAALPAVQAATVSMVQPGSFKFPIRAYQSPDGERAQEQQAAGEPVAGDSTRRAPASAAGDSTRTRADWPPRPSRYPLEHPYSPLADLRADTWRAQHPTWDGRGVTIADIEYAPDFFAPELQTALSLDGKPIRKFADVRAATDLQTAVGDTSGAVWLPMQTTVTAAGGRFTHAGRTYTAPRDGRFRLDALNERMFKISDRLKGDLNRDGNPKDADSLFAVLWDEATNTVWVDADQDGDFTDEPALKDFAVRGDIGTLGKDNPATPLREAIAFTVQIDTAFRAVALNLGIGSHGSLVMGAAAGARGDAGKYDGVAPGAQLASINYGSGSPAALTEALIMAFAHPKIDVVLLEQNVWLVDLVYNVNDGSSVTSLICARLIEHYKKPFVVPGGNTPGLAQVGEHASAAGAIGVGAYQGAESYLVNNGVVAVHADNLHVVGSGGPARNGGLKPDVLSPSNVLSSDVGYIPGFKTEGLFELPPGYTIAGGTSTATPVAAGSLALLISAAKQSGIPYDAQRLRRALLLSARHIPHIPTFDQGNGVINVAAAWDALVRMAKEPAAAAPVTIQVQAPVRTPVSDWLVPAHIGVGLYEMDWKAGQRGERTLTLTRTSGPKDARTYTARWRDARGVFTSAGEVTLPLNRPVAFPVTIAPPTAGSHSAILELVDPATDWPVQRISCVVVVPYTFATATDTITVRDSVPRPGRYNVFIDVPPGTAALAVDFSDVRGEISVSLARPDGRENLGWRIDSLGGLRYLPHPEPGVWELAMMGNFMTFHRFQPAEGPMPAAPFTLKATLASVAVEAAPGSAGAAAGDWTVTARNRTGAIPAVIGTTPLASGATARGRLGPGAQQVYTVDVPEGSTMLLARVTPERAAEADLDLYLFDCTSGTCVPAAAAADSGSAPMLMHPRPAAGTWKLVVDAARVRGDAVSYEYLDLVLNPKYGTAATPDVVTKREAGATWTTPARVWQAAPVPAPRQPYAVFLAEDGRVANADVQAIPPKDRLPVGWTAVPLAR